MFLDVRPGRLVDAVSGDVIDGDALEDAVARRCAQLGDLGIGPGDRATLHYGNRPGFFVDLLAIWRLGACAVPLDARATDAEILNVAAAARPRASLWFDPPGAAIAQGLSRLGVLAVDGETPVPPPSARHAPARIGLDDDALILFTSGTTGQPKGVVHTHRSLRARWIALRDALGTEACARTLCLLPTHFGHGLICNSLYPWLSGQDLFVLPPFRADLLAGLGETIDRHGITFMSSVPPVWRIALKISRPPQRGTLRRVFCGSAPLSAHLWQGIRTWTGAAEVCNVYGITETGSWIAGGLRGSGDAQDGLIGRPWGSVIRVLRRGDAEAPPSAADICAPGEEGFVWVHTPGLMRGYLGRDDLTSQVVSCGWFSTGDVGVMDERGLLSLRGRQREEINKGGAKIFPADVDAVLERLTGVLDVCTFALADPLYGENVGVALVLQEPREAVLGGLEDWTRRHLGEHRMPARWYVLPEIPRTSRGKINRAHVAETCAAMSPLSRDLLTRSPDTTASAPSTPSAGTATE